MNKIKKRVLFIMAMALGLIFAQVSGTAAGRVYESFKTPAVAESGASIFEKDDVIGLIGDSITHGYPQYGWWVQLEVYAATRFPDRNVRFINFGTGGINTMNTSRKFEYEFDSYNYNKTIINLGMNDSNTSSTTMMINYRNLLKKLEERNISVIALMTPPMYDADSKSAGVQNTGFSTAGLTRISGVIGQVAADYKLALIDQHPVYTSIQQLLISETPERLLMNTDRIHPAALGSAVTFAQIIKDLNLPGEVATVKIDAAALKVEAAGNCEISELAKNGDTMTFSYLAKALPISSTDYYKTAETLMDYTEMFNREYFYIKGLSAGEYELKIDGATVGRFSANELAAGVNLAKYNTPQMQQSAGVSAVALAMAQQQKELRDIVRAEYHAKSAGCKTQEEMISWMQNQRKTNASLSATLIFLYDNYINNTVSIQTRDERIENLWNSIYEKAQPVSRAVTLTKAASAEPVDPASAFPDVSGSNPYAAAIALLKQLSIVGGDDKGNFNPENTITRAEFAKILYVLYNGTPEAPKTVSKFPDVADNAWYNGYVNWAAAKGIVGGRDTGLFDPGAPVTIAEATKMLVVAATGKNTLSWPSGFEQEAQRLGLYEGASYSGINDPAQRQLVAQLAKNAIYKESVMLSNNTPDTLFFSLGANERAKDMVLIATWTRNARVGSDRMANAPGMISLLERGQTVAVSNFKQYAYIGGNIDELAGLPVKAYFDKSGQTVLYVAPVGSYIEGRTVDFTADDAGNYYFKGTAIELDASALVNNSGRNTIVRTGTIYISTQPISSVYFFGGHSDEEVTLVDSNGDRRFDFALCEAVLNGAEVADVKDGKVLLKNSYGSAMDTGWINGTFWFNYILAEGVEPLKKGDIVNLKIYCDCTSSTYASSTFPAVFEIVSKSESVSGTLTSVTAASVTDITVTVDGREYKWSNAIGKYSYSDGEQSKGELAGRPLMTQSSVGKSFTFYLDEAGCIVKAVQG